MPGEDNPASFVLICEARRHRRDAYELRYIQLHRMRPVQLRLPGEDTVIATYEGRPRETHHAGLRQDAVYTPLF